MTEKFCLNDRLFVSNRNITTEHVKIGENSIFFVPNSRIFLVEKISNLWFLRFPDKITNLMVF